jgi:hypothetical protein
MDMLRSIAALFSRTVASPAANDNAFGCNHRARYETAGTRPSRRKVVAGAVVFTGLGVLIGTHIPLPGHGNDNRPGSQVPPNGLRTFGGPQKPVCYTPKLITREMGISADEFLAFREAVAGIEHARYREMGGAGHHYAGRYQMGSRELRDTARALGLPTPSTAKFLGDPNMQELFFERYTLGHHEYLMKHNARYAGAPVNEKLEILGRAHNEGAAGASAWLNTGAIHLDGFGTDPGVYAKAVRRRLARLQ